MTKFFAALLLFLSAAESEAKVYGDVDIGGLFTNPSDASLRALEPGIALEIGGTLYDGALLVGGRLQLLPMAYQRTPTRSDPCWRTMDGCQLGGWGVGTFTAGLPVHLSFPVGEGWVLQVGLSLAFAVTCTPFTQETHLSILAAGFVLSADLRIIYRVTDRLGLHLTIEPQLFLAPNDIVDFMPAAWLGFDW